MYYPICYFFLTFWLFYNHFILLKEQTINFNFANPVLLQGFWTVLIIFTAWKVSKYGVFSVTYFAVFIPNAGKYGPEKAPYLDTFHTVINLNESYFKCNTLRNDLAPKNRTRIDLNLRLVKSASYLTTKMYWTAISVLGLLMTTIFFKCKIANYF